MFKGKMRNFFLEWSSWTWVVCIIKASACWLFQVTPCMWRSAALSHGPHGTEEPCTPKREALIYYRLCRILSLDKGDGETLILTSAARKPDSKTAKSESIPRVYYVLPLLQAKLPFTYSLQRLRWWDHWNHWQSLSKIYIRPWTFAYTVPAAWNTISSSFLFLNFKLYIIW